MKFRHLSIIICFFSCITPVLASAQGASQVVVTEVVSKPFHQRIEALGTLRANESVNVTANVTEIITATHFTDNQRVDKNHVLAEMTSSEEHALLKEAKATHSEARKQFERIRKLSKQGNAAKSLLDQRRREMQTAEARLIAVQSRLKDRLIIAPFAGVVGLRNISAGALVAPGDVIATLDDDSQMKLDFSVPAVYLDEIKVGLPIEATASAYSKKSFQGTITSINSRIDPVTRSFVVRALLPNPEYLLKPGLLMRVNITANMRDALVVPEAALVPQAKNQFVYIVAEQEEGKIIAQKKAIEIGGRRPGEVEVLSGVDEGQKVVIDGTIKLRDGADIIITQHAF